MLKTEETKAIEALAKQYQQKDKRLSWQTALKKAKQTHRLFNKH